LEISGGLRWMGGGQKLQWVWWARGVQTKKKKIHGIKGMDIFWKKHKHLKINSRDT